MVCLWPRLEYVFLDNDPLELSNCYRKVYLSLGVVILLSSRAFDVAFW